MAASFASSTNGFVFHNRNYEEDGVLDCGSKMKTKQFFKVDTDGVPNHTHNLTE
ncbi:MAG: hypothetical protein P8Z80_00855 [Pseudolabrys sp.]